MTKMALGKKIAVGFGTLILISLGLGGMAMYEMKAVSVESTQLATEYVPEVDVAEQIRGASNRIMLAMRGFEFTENDVYYQEALAELKKMETAIAKGHDLAQNAVHLKKLSGQIEAIDKEKSEYRAATEETYSTILAMSEQRKALNTNAAIYMKESAEFLEAQNNAFKKDLSERQKKIESVTQLVTLGSVVRIQNFKAQARNDLSMLQEAIRKLDDIKRLTDDLRKITREDEGIRRIDRTVAAAKGYQSAMRQFAVEVEKGQAADRVVLESARRNMDANAEIYVNACSEFFDQQQKMLAIDMDERHKKITLANDIINLGNDTRVIAFKSQAMRDPAMMTTAQKNFDKMDAKFADLRKITRLDEDIAHINAVHEAGRGYQHAMVDFLKDWKQLQNLGVKRDILGKKMIAACVVLAEAGMEQTVSIAKGAMHALNSASNIMGGGLIVALLSGIAMAVFITLSITRPVNAVISGLTDASDQVSSASIQISSASQSLAEGASEQAASLEETSSSLEEMSSMTKQNADHANEAQAMMKEAQKVVEKVSQHMGDMAKAVEEITNSSEETGKIIKTIDEIAFQTNLLALNAAVEAARAGEAGAGFAVVAEEVRTLALRAAEAAKDTSNLIENTLKAVGNGNELTQLTIAAFEENMEISQKVGILVADIAVASSEQASGIGQVNKAVAEMDKVTQQNAANAEESASASEQMSAQAHQLNDFVSNLVGIVGQKNGRTADSDAAKSRKASTRLANAVGNAESSRNKIDCRPEEISPAQVIPLDDSDFRDF